MARGVVIPGKALQNVGAGLFFLMVVAGGVLVLLYFWNQLLQPGDLNAVSLPLVALIAGVAATFNPCGMPAIPGFLAMGMGGREPPGVLRRGSAGGAGPVFRPVRGRVLVPRVAGHPRG